LTGISPLDILDRVAHVVSLFGYWGVAALMLLENVVPPIPSELIMPLAGFAAARGEMNLWGAIASGALGSVSGALIWYYIGRAFGLERICSLADRRGQWFGVSGKEIRSVQAWFSQQGGYWAIGLGRLIPGIRTYISVPAGVVQMPFGQFCLYTTVGSLGWVTLLTVAGFVLGENYELVSHFIGPISTGLIVVVSLLAVGWLVYRWRESSKES
jgi:membrane protein DedA with SNARE-associated domain